ncbi:MAG: STAS domain-containing protein [Bryobacteraceae bacterium]|jgi:anti-anti-sigma regulatory factor
MTTNAVWLKIDGERVAPALQEALAKLDNAGGEMVLDFCDVHRIDPGAIGELEKLAGIADGKSVKIVLHGVSVDIYKVLKLAKLAPRFSFLN